MRRALLRGPAGSVGTTLGCMQPLLSAGVFQLGALPRGRRGCVGLARRVSLHCGPKAHARAPSRCCQLALGV